MIKYIALALAAIIAVPVYCRPGGRYRILGLGHGRGSPTTRHKARAKYARRYHTARAAARPRSWPT